jgi:hypothetical protein
MATVRYQVDGVPETAWAHAFFPMPGLTPAASSSIRRFIQGYPGTERIPSPRPAGAYRASPSPQFQGPSDVAPDWFAPQLWSHDIRELPVGPTHAGTGINYLPHRKAFPVDPIVPQGTLGPLGPSQVAMTGRKVGGRRSMHWLRSVISWPSLGGTGAE